MRPSSAGRWVHCPGSIPLCETVPPQPSGPAAEEGTLAHEVAAALLMGEGWTGGAPEEMHRHVKGYVECVQGLGGIQGYETPVLAKSVHPELSGTCDAWAFDDGVLHVVDFKYGFGPVEAKGNWQLICYAVGLLDALGWDCITTVKLSIYQPRAWHPEGAYRTWTLTTEGLQPYVETMHDSLQDRSTLRVGEQCRYCPAKVICPALRAESGFAVDYALSQDDIPLDAVGQELTVLGKALSVLKFRQAALEERAMAALQDGKTVDGWMIGQGRGTREWAVSEADVREALGPHVATVVSPYQAEQRGIDRAAIRELTVTKPGKTSLKQSNAKEIFSNGN